MSTPPTIWLSHPLSPSTPAYGGGASMEQEPLSRIANGDTANTTRWSFPNHLGTHLDAPLHFFDNAPSVTDYPASFWVFEHPQVIDVPGEDGTLIVPEHVREELNAATDLLLLRTGFEAYRDEPRFWQRNPGMSAELGLWLRETHPNVRAVGMDVISVTSRMHRMEGRAAHRAFLDPHGEGHPIIAIEDMALAHIETALQRVVVAPWVVQGADGGPATVLGFG